MPDRKPIRLHRDAYAEPDTTFHLVIHARPGLRPFASTPVRDSLWVLVTNERVRSSIHLTAACLMPDHLHLVARAKDKDIASWMRDFKAFSTHSLRPLTGLRSIWQPRFYDRGLRSEEELEVCVAYVLRNPVDAGLVSEDEAWPWRGSWLEG